MSTTGKFLVDTALNRVRDPEGLAHNRAFVLARASDAQRFVNGALNMVTGTSSLTTEAHRLFYPITDSANNALRLIGVREGTRDLVPLTDIHQLNHLDTRWFRSTGSRFEAFVPIGRDLVVIYPAKTVASAVTLVYTTLTTALGNEQDTMDMPDEQQGALLSLVEAMLCLKQRDLDSADTALQTAAQLLSLDMGPVRWHLAADGVQPGRAQVLSEAP